MTNRLYQRDRIISPRRFLCRCVLVSPTHQSDLWSLNCQVMESKFLCLLLLPFSSLCTSALSLFHHCCLLGFHVDVCFAAMPAPCMLLPPAPVCCYASPLYAATHPCKLLARPPVCCYASPLHFSFTPCFNGAFFVRAFCTHRLF